MALFLKNKKRRPSPSFKRRRKTIFKRKPKIDLVTPKTNLPHYRLTLAVFFYHFSIAFVFSVVFYLIFISPLLLVKEVVVRGEEGIDTVAIKAKVEDGLLGKRFGFLRKDHLFWVPMTTIQRDVLEQFKNIKEFRLERRFPVTLRATATLKLVTVVFCGNDHCTVLDQEGTAIDVFPPSDLGRYGDRFVSVRDESNSNTEAGRGINTAEYVKFVTAVKPYLEENNQLKIKEIFSPLIFASELKLKTEEGWLLLADVKVPPNQLSQALKVVLSKEIKPEDRICLEYLDLRIPKRIYYKFFDDCEELKKNRENKEKGIVEGQDQTPVPAPTSEQQPPSPQDKDETKDNKDKD